MHADVRLALFLLFILKLHQLVWANTVNIHPYARTQTPTHTFLLRLPDSRLDCSSHKRPLAGPIPIFPFPYHYSADLFVPFWRSFMHRFSLFRSFLSVLHIARSYFFHTPSVCAHLTSTVSLQNCDVSSNGHSGRIPNGSNGTCFPGINAQGQHYLWRRRESKASKKLPLKINGAHISLDVCCCYSVLRHYFFFSSSGFVGKTSHSFDSPWY